MPMFVKKPVVIEARQFTAASADLAVWCGGYFSVDGKGAYIKVPTLEGELRAQPNDWIIKGVKGEFYPCKPDVFAATYEEVPS